MGRAVLVALLWGSWGRALCATDPGWIALLHVDAGGSVVRIPLGAFDCATGILSARISSTSSVVLPTLASPAAVTSAVLSPSPSARQPCGNGAPQHP